jgi:hypothetical protein
MIALSFDSPFKEEDREEHERQEKAEAFQQWLEYSNLWREQKHEEESDKNEKANKAKYLHKMWMKEREICDVKAEKEKSLRRISAK